jgi:hypothetical protein
LRPISSPASTGHIHPGGIIIEFHHIFGLVIVHYTGANPIGGLIAGIKAHIPVDSVGSRVIGGDHKGIVSKVRLGQGSSAESKGKDKNQDKFIHFTPFPCFILFL